MDCDRIKDLLADYHLGHLPPDEAEEARRHLAEHPECRESLSEVAEVMDLIPAAMTPMTPPPELKYKILSRIEKGEPPERASASELSRPAGDRRPRAAVLLLASGLGIALVALVSLTFAYINLDRENDRLEAEAEQIQQEAAESGGLQILTASGTTLAPEARGTVVTDASDGSVALAISGLPDLPADSGYHAWLVDSSGEPVSLGVMDVSERGEGRMTDNMEGLADFDGELEITSQPEGSQTHSGEVFLRAGL